MNERIRQLRNDLHLSQAEFGAKINLSQNYIWMIEKGDRTPSDRTIADIAREFGVSLAWLEDGEGEMPCWYRTSCPTQTIPSASGS